jgi:hypothetical protein
MNTQAKEQSLTPAFLWDNAKVLEERLSIYPLSLLFLFVLYFAEWPGCHYTIPAVLGGFPCLPTLFHRRG